MQADSWLKKALVCDTTPRRYLGYSGHLSGRNICSRYSHSCQKWNHSAGVETSSRSEVLLLRATLGATGVCSSPSSVYKLMPDDVVEIKDKNQECWVGESNEHRIYSDLQM